MAMNVSPRTRNQSFDRLAECWAPIAATVGPRHERDLAYRHRSTGERLLVRFSGSITQRRLDQANTILSQADFDWVVLVPDRHDCSCRCDDPRLAIIAADKSTLVARRAGLI
jgi:hypothetical protein